MSAYSKDKNIDSLVKELVKQGWQVVRNKHWQILTPDRKRKICIPLTPSCSRAWMNFRADIKRLCRTN